MKTDSKCSPPPPDPRVPLSQQGFWSGIDREIEEKVGLGLARQIVESTPCGPTRVIRNGREMLHFASNDYLALGWHPKVRLAYQTAPESSPAGAEASPLILGATPAYSELVRTLCGWQKTEAAVVFSSGYAANSGTINALVTSQDLILSDALNHACLIDGCRLSKGTIQVYPHRDMDRLTSLMREHRQNFRMAFVITDSVFSMDGDLAPIPKIEAICREFQAIPVLDEAHASGVFGARGCGLLEEQGGDKNLWIKTGTLSKAIGCAGGFVVGNHLLSQALIHKARPWIFSTALPPAVLYAAARSIEILQGMVDERSKLKLFGNRLRNRIQELGYRTGSDETPIIPIYVDGPEQAIRLSEHLQEHGIYVPAIRPPTVPAHGCLLRVSINAAHTESDAEELLRRLASAKSSF